MEKPKEEHKCTCNIKKEEPKQETVEEAAERLAYDSTEENKGFPSMKRFIEGAKWMQERMYSEEDLKEAFKGGGKMSWTDINQETQEPYYYDFKERFEQF